MVDRADARTGAARATGVRDHDHGLRVLFERAVRGVVRFLADDLQIEGGGFASSLDADSCDIRGMVHEGIYYVWSPELLTDALGEAD